MSRNKTPTNLRIVKGNPGKRALPANEPTPDFLNDLSAPAYLSESAKEVWSEIAPNLRKNRLLTVVDIPMLSMACVAIAQYRKATGLVQENVLIKSNGGPIMHPALIVQSMTFKQAILVLREFGMSPSARSRVVVNSQGDLFGSGKEDKGSQYFS